ncbi:MAG: hypothetical protein ACE5PV_17185 [Candidatus Poribacteria bacterium]
MYPENKAAGKSIHTSSNPCQFANISVIDESQAVEAEGKLATFWGAIKSMR